MSDPDEAGGKRAAPRGRGAAGNPANRFERIHVEPEEPPPGKVRTLFLADSSRSIIATNDSPDIPFDASINPYRGCEHGCPYCLAGDTPILMADGTTRSLRDVKVGDEIYGTRREGWYRRFVRTRVLKHWATRKPAFAVEVEDGARLVASSDHRFLTERGWKWVTGSQHGKLRRPHLTLGNKLMGTGRVAHGPDFENADYRRGYLCGVIRGDGHLGSYEYERPGRRNAVQHRFRLALVDWEPLARTRAYLVGFGVPVDEFVFQVAVGERRRMDGIRTSAKRRIDRIRELIEWPTDPSGPWIRGFLAGIYDAEGGWSHGVLRIFNTDLQILDWVKSSLHRLGVGFAAEVRSREDSRPEQAVRITGGLSEALRFWHTIGNAIARKRSIEGCAIKSRARLGIRSIEPLDEKKELFDITTGTGDFIADGVVSHNCYARPGHEYLGFSAGLDFESRILVKERAPELLERELSSPRWKPQVLGISGVTDAYQPVERKLRITRRCLEVLARFRNPVSIVTKNALVTRDADLLGELAAHRAAAVYLSITTLDAALARRLEPRASHPAKRLEAVGELAAAGIPAGVLIAPVIPGLNDHEIPAILEAAAAAGARSAAYLILRLPGAVAELFPAWLEANVPERKGKVMSRLREMRGGRVNDARFGVRHRGEGVFAEQIRALFTTARRRVGLSRRGTVLSTAAFRRPGGEQLGLLG